MSWAFVTTVLFSISVVCGHRSAKLVGGAEANFWRLTVALFFLATWAHSFGQGAGGNAFPLFLLSGLIGIGFGDVAFFEALPHLGSRLTVLLVQCLSAPFAALIEWGWLGTRLSALQILLGIVVLGGVGMALSPGKHLTLSRRELLIGSAFGALAALGNSFGAVLSRKGYEVARNAGQNLDGITAAYQRVLGGLLIAGLFLLFNKRQWLSLPSAKGISATEKWRRVWPWVLANGLAGQTLGVSCYQWALKISPTGVVLPIVALTPIVVIPFAWFFEKERPAARSIIGGLIAVAGAIALARAR